MLRPLEQFICDNCGEIIQEPSHGYVEWKSDQKASGFKIVHHISYSPFANEKKSGCYHDEQSIHREDSPLPNFLGEHTMPELLRFLDFGPYHEPEYNGPRVVDMREFVEFTRRLTIPFYEEARQYWNEAIQAGEFEDMDPISIYLSDNLRNIIERYINE